MLLVRCSRTRLLSVTVGGLLILLPSCRAPDPPPVDPRTAVRAQAGALLEEAARQRSARAAELKLQAAALLERLWRAGGEPQDIEQAMDVYASVGVGELSCRSQLRAATLRVELTGQPEVSLERIRTLREMPGCRTASQVVLTTLVAEPPTVEAEQWLPPVAVPPDGRAAGRVKLLRVERYGSRDAARIVVFLSGPTTYEVGVLPPLPARGPRLFVDLQAASYDGQPSFEVGGIVERVRLGAREGGTRVVLDLRERVLKRVFYLPEPFRLVLDVSGQAPSGKREGERAIERVVLDPGHGGHDPGAIGPHGLQEKDVALDVAHRAAPLIARELGISTLLTRDVDDFVPLDERVAKANAFGADLFISIHCNASENAQGRGVMTFVLEASRDALARQVAARENAASAEAAQQLAHAMRHFMDERTVERSSRFAGLLQRASVAALSRHFRYVDDGGVRRAGFYVLAGAQMPAVLFETSFISNSLEEERLDSAVYRQKLADGVVNAIRAYQDGG